MNQAAGARFYVTGGTLKPNAPSYVERPADGELWRLLEQGEYCYVLTSRQMGKSSLMARTAARLRQVGHKAAVVDLTQIGLARAEASADSWYLGVLHAVHRGLSPATPLKTWWRENSELSPTQRFVEYFREVALTAGEERLVVFVDEIDSTIGLPFGGDFFAAIRACYNARAEDAAFDRLSFVLVGVATPDQLIDDPARTPFNVGRRIEVTDFTPDEARRLVGGLGGEPGDGAGGRGEAILDRVLYWTGGQPYLTQVLCQQVAEFGDGDEDAVDRLVEDCFVAERALHEETHLRHIRRRLGGEDIVARQRLKLYRRMLKGAPVRDDPTSPTITALKLCGVVRLSADGRLLPRNRLYECVFDAAWARREMPADRTRMVAYGTLSAMAGTILIWYAESQSRPYKEQLRLASEDFAVATAAYERLRANPVARFRANELLAQFWDRRARSAALREDRGRVVLSWLQAARTADTNLRRREAEQWISGGFDILRATLRHRGTANAVVAFSPDGKSVVTGSSDSTARLWSAHTGSPIGQPMSHESWVLAVAFSPGGKRVMSGSDDGTARLWNVPEGSPIGQPMRHSDLVLAVAFSPDGKSVVTGSFDFKARLWSAHTGSPIGEPMEHKDGVLAVAFSPDGKNVVSGSADGTARLWSAHTGASVGAPMAHEGAVLSVAFSPDGKSMVTGSDDGAARLWSTHMGTSIGEPMPHEDGILAVTFSPDGSTVLTGSDDGAARLWSPLKGAPDGKPMRLGDFVRAMAISLDGSTVVMAGRDDRTARLWSARTDAPIGAPMPHGNFVRVVAFSPDGKSVVTGSDDGTARLWNALTGAPMGQIMRHKSWVGAVAFSLDGLTVVTGSWDGTARLWSALTGASIGAPMQHESLVGAVAFSPDGSMVVTGSWDRTARLWSAHTGAPIGEPMGPKSQVRAVAFSPDGSTVVTGSNDGSVRLWSVRTRAPLGPPVQHKSRVLAVAFSPVGSTVVIQTDQWVHLHAVTADGLEHLASRFVGTGLTNVFRFSDDCADCLEVAVRPTANSLRIETIHLLEPDAPPIEGAPDELLEEWQRRLALEFDERMNIVPRWPIPTPSIKDSRVEG